MVVDLTAEEVRELTELLEEEILDRKSNPAGEHLLSRLKTLEETSHTGRTSKTAQNFRSLSSQ